MYSLFSTLYIIYCSQQATTYKKTCLSRIYYLLTSRKGFTFMKSFEEITMVNKNQASRISQTRSHLRNPGGLSTKLLIRIVRSASRYGYDCSRLASREELILPVLKTSFYLLSIYGDYTRTARRIHQRELIISSIR